MELIDILVIGASILAGTFFTVFLARKQKISLDKVQGRGQEMISKASQDVEIMKKELTERIAQIKKNEIEAEKTFKEFIEKIEEIIQIKEENVKRKEMRIQELQKVYTDENTHNQELQEKNKQIAQEIVSGLASRAGEKKEVLRSNILETLTRELKEENEIRLAHLEEFYAENAEQEAKNVILNCLQRLSSPTSNEKKGAQVTVPKDHLKLKLIGKNAGNLKKLEELLEIDVILNDFPNTITVSHYNILTRHIAKKTIEKIFEDPGEVTPEKIAQKIEEAKKDTDRELLSMGKEAMKRMNIKRVFPDEMLQIVGRLQFRTSYGQNIMRHSYEVGLLALMMGYELGLDVETCKIGGFLHDLGKAIDQNPDIIGAHDYLTKELMEKYNFPEKEVHAAWTHHDSEPPRTPEAFLIKGADAISASRPGARQEALDKYIERIHQLEDIATSYEGVSKVQIMSAGRELRVMVDPKTLEDDLLDPLATNIAKEVKENVAYPGYVRVNVIRRTQSTEVAK